MDFTSNTCIPCVWHCFCTYPPAMAKSRRKDTGSKGCPGLSGESVGRAAVGPKTYMERTKTMKKLLAAVLSVAVAVTLSPALSSAQSSSCPAEVTQAKDLLSKKTASVKPDDIQAPRSLAGARQNEAQQAPRGNQNVQAPRGNQDVQAPRGNQDGQAPRGNPNGNTPRGAPDVHQNRRTQRGKQSREEPRG